MPARDSLRNTIADPDFRPVMLVGLLKNERDSRTDIREPAMYPMIAGLPWVEPAKFASIRRTLPDQQRVARVLSSLEAQETAIERLSTRRAALADADGRNKAAAQRLDREITRAQEERDRIVVELADLGFDEEGKTIEQDMMEGDGETLRSPGQNLLDENEPISVWAHDVSLEPGQTYRYQMRLVLTNPLFGRETRLTPRQKPEARSLVMGSAFSDWSDPIYVPADVQFFVLDASPQREENGLFQPSFARVQACEFFYGFWRTAQARIGVGSMVHAVTQLPELEVWAITDSDDGPVLGAAQMLPRSHEISADEFLLGVGHAIAETSALGLDARVFLHHPDGPPETRTPASDRAKPELAVIRFSASRGKKTAMSAEDDG